MPPIEQNKHADAYECNQAKACDAAQPSPRSHDELQRRMNFALQRAAGAWCHPATSHKVMDVELTQAFAEILCEEMYATHLGCATTGQIINELRCRCDLNYKTTDPL